MEDFEWVVGACGLDPMYRDVSYGTSILLRYFSRRGTRRCLEIQGELMRRQAYVYDYDDRFFPGWRLDTSWILCTASWSAMILLGAGVSATALLLPSEEGYELIPSKQHSEEEEEA